MIVRVLSCLTNHLNNSFLNRVDNARGWTTIVLSLLLLSAAPLTLSAQDIYSPEHDQVKETATKGLAYLSNNLPGDTGEAILAGIACIEYTKRYSGYVDADLPLVTNAIKKADAAMVGDNPLTDHSSLYAPCLALILYCECGDEKYQVKIQQLLDALIARQNFDGGFGYNKQPNIGDTSQTQYAALALWVAQKHGFEIAPEVAKKTLEWICQSKSSQGSWFYKMSNQQPHGSDREHRHSIHCSGLSSVYLLADYLNLNRSHYVRSFRKKVEGLELPQSVSIHVATKQGGDPTRPLINFNMKLLNDTSKDGNHWLQENWTVESETWNYYYLYALERYAFFREKAEGSLSDFPNWYDQGVTQLLRVQDQGNGGWPSGATQHASSNVNTSFSVMFLVRATQVLVTEGRAGTVVGSLGFEPDVSLLVDGAKLVPSNKLSGIDQLFAALEANDSDFQLERVLSSLGEMINIMSTEQVNSRNERLSFLRGLVGDANPLRREIAIRLLAATQEIDNAPALIHALNDNNSDVRLQAHNGLRLLSRKIDSIQLSEMPSRAEYKAIKERWTDWYLTINPGAELLD